MASDFDLVCLSETWTPLNFDIDLMHVTGYTVTVASMGRRGSGLAIYARDSLTVTQIDSRLNDDIEYLWMEILFSKQKVAVGCVYRPHRGNFRVFLNYFEDIYDSIFVDYPNNICLGDFNVNLLDLTNNSTATMIDSLNILGIKQLIDKPTRIALHSSTLIDYILVPNNMNVVESDVIPFQFSDHELVYCILNLKHQVKSSEYKVIRHISSIPNNLFLEDLCLLPWHRILYEPNVNLKVGLFNTYIAALFDAHAPERLVFGNKRKCLPYITDNIKLLISLRNKAFMKAKKSKQEAHWNYYKFLRNYTNQAVQREKKAYCKFKFSTKDPKKLWSELSKFNIHQKTKTQLPIILKSPDNINSYFIDCVYDIVRTIQCPSDDLVRYYTNNRFVDPTNSLFKFSLVTEDTVVDIITGIKTNAVGTDGISIQMIKKCLPTITPILTNIVNECILTSVFPLGWKYARVLPLNKVKCPTRYSDLRPLSILPVLSKVLERIMTNQFEEYICRNCILPDFQSGFRAHYSCTTALLNILDDVLRAHDNNHVTVMVLLDFSKAFDTLNQQLLLAKLHYYGVSDEALNLFCSYFQDRQQCVSVDNDSSNFLRVRSGVPQGSIISPLLFSIYTSDFHRSLTYCKYHYYADDTQLYFSFPSKDVASANCKINADLDSFVKTAEKHSLKINKDKSSVMVFGPTDAASEVKRNLTIKIGGHNLAVVDSARNLGVIIDSQLRFEAHIKNLLQKSFFKLKMLYGCRDFLDCRTKRLLCDSLILSNFNHCCQVFGFSLTKFWQARVQRVQNACLRFIFSIKKGRHVSHTLKIVKWLNMKNRFHFHAITLVHKVLIEKKPSYLHRKILFRADVHNVNIRRRNLIDCPKHKLHIFERSFTYIAYRLYNSVSSNFQKLNLNNFKTKYRQFLLGQQENQYMRG